ncbi:hypothetical protein NB231_02483 [Nitrococcus mobilis Nb-231]|uniref:Uncharacterized protein n=1 Tax=Nitrococcus mobilis Nb-231 TaxID=314278 RepID=A4BRM6_9GAMM|nr:hypothetical protein NB231_02483 [Nitrococcus mobilis Nb-231]
MRARIIGWINTAPPYFKSRFFLIFSPKLLTSFLLV